MRSRDFSRIGRRQSGYALLAVIFALMVIAVSMTVVIPDARLQARRELEIEMMFRGEQMAEAIARYYSGGRLTQAGVIVKSPPPPYGYLTELKKLRDGVTVGANELFLVRASAYLDPLTGLEWEPVRIGDARLRKYFRQWQQATGRQIPPIYLSYLPRGNILDTSPTTPDGSQPGDTGEPPKTDGETGNPDGGFSDDEDEDDDDEDFDDDDEDSDDEDDDEDFDDGAMNRHPEAALFINAAYQEKPLVRPQGSAQPQQGRPQQPTFAFTGNNRPIIGVATRARGKSVRTRFGIEKYEEMLFIFIPQNTPAAPNQPQRQQPQVESPGQPPINDRNGDGIDDSLTPSSNRRR